MLSNGVSKSVFSKFNWTHMNKQKVTLLGFLIVFGTFAMAQDTIVVQALNYNTPTRDTIVHFPDGTESYSKILMRYAMRCKGARVSTGANRNLGCGEWDYSCNTYIEDPSRIDSFRASTPEYAILNFDGTTYSYKSTPVNSLYRNTRRTTTVVSKTDTSKGTILGAETESVAYILPTSNNPESGYAGKAYYLYTASELSAAGLQAGSISALSLISNNTSNIENLHVRIRKANNDTLAASNLETNEFISVFLDNLELNIGKNTLTFHTPFSWDGISNLVIEFTSNGRVNMLSNIESHRSDAGSSLVAFGGRKLHFDGKTTYVEADNYPGILGTQDRTIDVWIKTDKVNGEICSWGKDAPGQKWVFRVNGDGTLRTEVNGGGINGTTVITDNKWHHVACVFSGTNIAGIKHYVDGKLDPNGAVTPANINTVSDINVRISRGINNRYYKGELDEIRIWNVALSAAELQQVKNQLVVPQDPRIALHYQFNVVDETTVFCSANTPKKGTINGFIGYTNTRALAIFKDYFYSPFRPTLTLYGGNYDITTSTSVNYDTVPNLPNEVIRYAIQSRANTTEFDILKIAERLQKWDADKKTYYYDEAGLVYDSATVVSDGSITIKNLALIRRWPSRLEIMSFVTPYGIGLDLGPEGKSWTFDVTDFTPILKGNKRLFLGRGGENQEEMDIQFLFIKGTPAREVLDIRQIWPTQQYQPNYTQILANDVYFPPVNFRTMDIAKGFKIRSAITGHGQQGEFIPRNHFIKANDQTYMRSVWKSCGDNPIYPQGGTWIYDRAGWCPSMATDVAEYDLTQTIQGGENLLLDYGIENGQGDSRYIINNQLVSYGEYNFGYDLSIEDIIEPSNKVEHARSNPTCISPKMTVRNNGKNKVYNMTIDYWVNNRANKRTFTWECDMATGDVETVYFPIDNSVYSTGNAANNVFYAEITAIEGNTTADEYQANNVFQSPFELPEVYPKNFFLFYRTNNAPNENKVTLLDEWGKVVFERDQMTANTLYRDTLNLGLGCYKLIVEDTDGDGLSFFANNDGSGFFRLWEVGGTMLKTLNPDFGNKTELQFTVVHALDVPKHKIDLGYELYPNPSQGEFTVSGGDLKGATHHVYNNFGQKIVAPYTNNEWSLKYDLSNEPSGIYTIRIEKNGVLWTHKVIVH